MGDRTAPDFGPRIDVPTEPGLPDFGGGPGRPRFPDGPLEPDFGPHPPDGPLGPDTGPHPGPGGVLEPGLVFPVAPGLGGILHSKDGKDGKDGGGKDAPGDGGGDGGDRPEGYPPPDDITTKPGDREHILDGDKAGGGHRPGTGKPGKTEFPQGWSDDKIIREIEDVARNPDPGTIEAPRYPGDYWAAEGTRDGVEIRIVVRPDGSIRTGYPITVEPNPAAV